MTRYTRIGLTGANGTICWPMWSAAMDGASLT